MESIDPAQLASEYRAAIAHHILQNKEKINVIGFLATDRLASLTYANYTKHGCDDVGINFKLIKLSRLDMEEAILKANEDDEIHGIFIYYPIFTTEQDTYLKNLVSPYKDIEGLSDYWAKKLYSDTRIDQGNRHLESILPCTPLAIMKLLESLYRKEEGKAFEGKVISIFNRSEVVGRPLARLLSYEGAHVISFDEKGAMLFTKKSVEETDLDRKEALLISDIVITGVPNKKFKKIQKSELKNGAIGLNFSTIQNFELDALESLSAFIPRVGPLTIAMCLKNALKLYHNYSKKIT